MGRGVWLAAAGLLSREGRAAGKSVCTLAHILECHPMCLPVPQLPLPASPTTSKGQRKQASFLEGSCTSSCEGWQFWRQLESEMRCSCEREVTSPGSAQQLQATAMSEKCSCLYSCSLFQLPFVWRHVTADAPHHYNRYLDSFAAGTSKCNPANQTLC